MALLGCPLFLVFVLAFVLFFQSNHFPIPMGTYTERITEIVIWEQGAQKLQEGARSYQKSGNGTRCTVCKSPMKPSTVEALCYLFCTSDPA